MSLFPLYDQIILEMDGTETILNKCHSSTINKLDQEHLNIIYLIILHHYYTSNNQEKYNIPYGAKTIADGKGISFRRLNQIPEELQKIIYRYLEIVKNN